MRILLIVLIVGIFAVSIYLFSRKQTSATTENSMVSQPGLLSAMFNGLNISNLFNIHKKDQSAACDVNRPGYDINGFPSVACGFGS